MQFSFIFHVNASFIFVVLHSEGPYILYREDIVAYVFKLIQSIDMFFSSCCPVESISEKASWIRVCIFVFR